MGKKRAISLLIALLILLLATGAALAAENLIANGDFAQGLEGWYYENDGVFVDEDEEDRYLTLANEDFSFGFVSRELSLEPETQYLLECDIYTIDIDEDSLGACYYIDDYDAMGENITGTTDVWYHLTTYIKTDSDPLQQHYLTLSLDGKGYAFFDNVSLSVYEGDAGATVYSIAGGARSTPQSYVDPLDKGDNGESGGLTLSDIYNNYNAITLLVVCLILLAGVYLFTTGRWSRRYGSALTGRAFIIGVFALGLIARLLIGENSPGYTTDMSCFKAWAMNIFSDPAAFYDGEFFADYPPVYMFVLYIVGLVQSIFGIAWDTAAFTLMVKLPAIICDLALAFMVYRFAAKRVNELTGALLALFILLNPALIVDSASWGQVDSVFMVVMLASVFYLHKDKKLHAAAFFMLAVMVKPQALLFAPLFAAVYIIDACKKGQALRGLKTIGLSVLIMLGVYTLTVLPFITHQPWWFMFQKLLESVGSYAYASVNAFNLFALCGGNFVSDETPFLLADYRMWGVAFILMTIALTVVIYAKRRDKRDIFLLCAITVVGIFALGHHMHERYLFPAIIFLLCAVAVYRSRKLYLSAALVSAGLLINEYIVLVFNGEVAIPQVIVAIFSVLNLAVFIFFGYAAFCALRGERADFAPEPEPRASLYSRANKNAADRLLKPREHSRLSSRDYIIMLAITVVYGVVALTNLGSLVIPETGTGYDTGRLAESDSIVYELAQPTEITTYKYYAGYGETEYTIELSDDGTLYTGTGEILNHEFGDMFRWQFHGLGMTTKFIRFRVTDGGALDMRELALVDADDKLIPATAYYERGGVLTPAPELTDEAEQVPVTTSYMTNMYFDEIYHARTAYEYMHGIYPYEITHPPLGKAIIALGCEIFGFNPFGWRVMGAFTGILMLPVLYLLAFRLLKKTKWAAIATVLFAADFMHFAQTRISTIDSYSILFILLMYLFMFRYMDMSFHHEKLSRTFIPLGLCGVFFGIGAATKWLCIYAGLGLAILFFYTMLCRYREYRLALQAQSDAALCPTDGKRCACCDGENPYTAALGFKRKFWLTIAYCVLMFIIIPLAIYCVSYIPYFNAKPDFGLAGIWANQTYMLNYHATLNPETVHPFSSHFYTWPLMTRPVYFFLAENSPAGMTAFSSTFGNPLVWWGGIAAMLYLLGMRKREHASFAGLGRVGIAAASGYLPWVLVSREVYIYHFFAVVPFMILAIVYVLRDIWSSYRYGRHFVIAFTALSVVLFIMFYPAITGVPCSWEYSQFIRWLPSWPPY